MSNALETVFLAYFESVGQLDENDDAKDVMQSMVTNVVQELKNLAIKASFHVFVF